MLNFQPIEFDLISLMLGLLLQTAGARGQFVLLLARLGTHIERKLRHGCHIVDGATQLVQFLANIMQLARIWRQIVAIPLASLATVLFV